jgi:hypothetical protein
MKQNYLPYGPSAYNKNILHNSIKRLSLGTTLILLTIILSCSHSAPDDKSRNFPKEELPVTKLPDKANLWIFIMAGQSNMAGRGFVEPQDTLPSKRILTINQDNTWILAKEPLHFYQPKLTGLDCGMEFARFLENNLCDSIYIGILPCAVGGSSISQWLNDSLFNQVQLFSNFREKAGLGKKYGTIKGILWHQGETDAMKNTIADYKRKLTSLFSQFRDEVGNNSLPIIIGELGNYAGNEPYRLNRDSINTILKKIANSDPNCYVVPTNDLLPKENDPYHFNGDAQRILGQRYAKKYLRLINITAQK